MTDPAIVRTPSGALAGTMIDTDHGPVAPVRRRAVRDGAGRRRPVPGGASRRRRGRVCARRRRSGRRRSRRRAGRSAGTVPGMAVTAVDEDCLTLNVWRPATGEPTSRCP